MLLSHLLFVCTLLVAAAVQLSQGAVFSGYIADSRNEQGFAYMGKFCFDYTVGAQRNLPAGEVHIEIKIPMHGQASPPAEFNDGIKGLQFWMFDDEESSWQSLRPGMTCNQKGSKARDTFGINEWWRDPLTNDMVYRHKFDISEHIRPRTWWFVLANCGDPFGHLHWELKMKNLNAHVLNKEFGVGEYNLPVIYLFALFAVAGITAFHFQGIYFSPPEDMTEEALANFRSHFLVRLFGYSLIALTAALFMKEFHLMVYAFDGKGNPFFDHIHDLADVAAKLTLSLLLMLMANGWTISSVRIKEREKILIALACFGSLYVLLLITKFYMRDSWLVYVPGTLSMFLNLLTFSWCTLAGWFLYTILQTYQAEYKDNKKQLYMVLAVIYTVWLASEPVGVLLVEWLDPWVRDKIVVMVTSFTTTLAYGYMAWVMSPVRASEYFILDTPDVEEKAGGADDDL